MNFSEIFAKKRKNLKKDHFINQNQPLQAWKSVPWTPIVVLPEGHFLQDSEPSASWKNPFEHTTHFRLEPSK